MTEITGIDHIYITVSDLARSEAFYDQVLLNALGFRKNKFTLGDDAHVQYFNRHFGYVLRPARNPAVHDAYAPGLHHFCLRVDSAYDVTSVAEQLRSRGIDASPAAQYPQYAPDYWATFFHDPDGIRLEVTNYRQERRERHDNWSCCSAGTAPELAPSFSGDIEIRLIRNEDIYSIIPLLQLLNATIPTPTLHERLTEMLTQGYQCAGLYHQGKLAGICGLWIMTKYYIGKHIEPDNVVLLPEYRGMGLGKQLMAWVYHYGQTQGCVASELNCYLPNARGHAFWENEGYTKTAYHYRRLIPLAILD